MGWRDKVNGALSRLTGYELRRAPLNPVAARAGGKGARVRSAEPALAGAAPASPGKTITTPAAAKQLQLPRDYDEAAQATIREVKPWTMTSPEKLNALILSVRHVVKHDIPGAVVECGVWRGGSMQAAARTLMEAGDTSRGLYLFDTFEGMSAPTDKDRRRHDGASAADLLHSSPKESGVWAVATLDHVQSGMARIGYPEERVHYVQGMVEDTIPERAPEQISILRLDTDWYESTKHELNHLYPRLSSGGVLLLDDYGWWEGAKTAVDEWLEKTGERLLLLRMAEGRVAVKP
ncbi:TylF/MycF/NovP-related O-methyltransferase [Intrasporangium sp.]|uniref:TylF/MycF/NovP-related O-methyltransferase n=1 Tax=Intrasporangium sp. TaxID=1925024 RepID=UPI0033659DC6